MKKPVGTTRIASTKIHTKRAGKISRFLFTILYKGYEIKANNAPNRIDRRRGFNMRNEVITRNTSNTIGIYFL